MEKKDGVVDISGLVTQDRADEGVWVQAEIYGRKQPFEIRIVGADSDSVVLYNRRAEKEASRALGAIFGKKSDDAEAETAEEIKEKKVEGAVVRMAGLRSTDGTPLMLQGVELGCDVDSYRLLCRKVPAVIDFVVQRSNDREVFLSGRKKD